MMLLDTCAMIWDALDSNKLTVTAKRIIEQADRHSELYLCDISIWEVTMLIKRQRLTIDASASAFVNLFLQARNITVCSITPDIAELSVQFGPEINNDPADRLIAATSIVKKAPIVTADNNLRACALLTTIW